MLEDKRPNSVSGKGGKQGPTSLVALVLCFAAEAQGSMCRLVVSVILWAGQTEEAGDQHREEGPELMGFLRVSKRRVRWELTIVLKTELDYEFTLERALQLNKIRAILTKYQ